MYVENDHVDIDSSSNLSIINVIFVTSHSFSQKDSLLAPRSVRSSYVNKLHSAERLGL
jgi:hypothetical protein